MNIHNRTIIVLILLVIVIVIFSLWIYVLPQLDIIKQSENNQQQLPAGVIEEIENTRLDEYSYFSKWEANYSEQTVTIYLNCIMVDNKKPDKTIDEWTIRWEQDPEIYNETAENVYREYLKKWEKDHPQQKIVWKGPDVCNKRVIVPVFNITPEIQDTEILVDGWRIIFVQVT